MSSMGPLSGAAGPRRTSQGALGKWAGSASAVRHHAAAVQMHTQRDHMHPVLNNKFRGKIMLSLYSLTRRRFSHFLHLSPKSEPKTLARREKLAGTVYFVYHQFRLAQGKRLGKLFR
jgi:hypothetical protein